MTANDWLKLLADDPEKCIRKLSERLVGKPWKHELEFRTMRSGGEQGYECLKCETIFNFPDRAAYLAELPCCPIPDFLDITWDRGKAEQAKCNTTTDNFVDILCEVYAGDVYDVLCFAEPHHYLIAAAMVAEQAGRSRE